MEDKRETQSSTVMSQAGLAKLRSEVADKFVASYEEPFDSSGGLTSLQALNISVGKGPDSHRKTGDTQDSHINGLIEYYKSHRDFERTLKKVMELPPDQQEDLVARLQKGLGACEKLIRIYQEGRKFPVDRMGRAVVDVDGGTSDPHYPRIHLGAREPSMGAGNESGTHTRNGSANAEVEQSFCVATLAKPMVLSNTPDTGAEMEDIEATVARLGLTMDGPDIGDNDEDGDVGLTEGELAKEKLEL